MCFYYVTSLKVGILSNELNYRITEYFELEGTSGGQVVHSINIRRNRLTSG